MSQTRSIITGANGFLGQWLVRRLLAEGHEVSVVLRNPKSLDAELASKVKIYQGDVTKYDSLLEPFKNKDAVFHLAGLIAYKRKELPAMYEVNVTGTQNVIAAMVAQGVSRLLHLSSVVAVGASFTPQNILDEDSPYLIGHLKLGYFDTKHEAEKRVVAAVKENKIQAVMINPSTIYGPGDATKGSRKTQVKVARGGFPFYTAGGVSVVDVEDVVNAIVSGFNKGRNGERYIVAGDNVTIKQLFEIIARCGGVKPPEVYMPTMILKTLGFFGDTMNQLGMQSSLSIENAYTASMFHWFKHDKAARELDFRPQPAELAIEKSVRWMRDHGLLNKG